MNCDLPEPSPALTDQVATFARENPARVFPLEHERQRLIIKKAAPQDRGRVQAMLVGWVCWRLTGVRLKSDVLLLSGGQEQLEFEARRLLALQAAAVDVPAVHAVGDGWLALQDVGQNLQDVMRTLPLEQSLELLEQLIVDLAEFHRAGHWHGGSQIRNLTLLDDRRYRIDFEENLDALPLPLIQAFDLALFLNSCVRHLSRTEADTVAVGSKLLDIYFQAHPDEEVEQCLQRGYEFLRWLRLPLRLLGRWSGRDGIRLRLILEIIDAYLSEHSRLARASQQ